MNRRMIAAISALALLPATMIVTGSAAQAAAPRPSVHGCPGGDVCLYNAKAHYNNDKPDVIDNAGAGVFLGGTNDLVAVNNTASSYSSQGFVESHFKNGMLFLCTYAPDAADEQSPGTTENPADDSAVTAIAIGSKTVVDTGIILPLNDCSGS